MTTIKNLRFFDGPGHIGRDCGCRMTGDARPEDPRDVPRDYGADATMDARVHAERQAAEGGDPATRGFRQAAAARAVAGMNGLREMNQRARDFWRSGR